MAIITSWWWTWKKSPAELTHKEVQARTVGKLQAKTLSSLGLLVFLITDFKCCNKHCCILLTNSHDRQIFFILFYFYYLLVQKAVREQSFLKDWVCRFTSWKVIQTARVPFVTLQLKKNKGKKRKRNILEVHLPLCRTRSLIMPPLFWDYHWGIKALEWVIKFLGETPADFTGGRISQEIKQF